MKKAELLAAVDASRAGWEAVIAELGPGGLEQSGACGDWSVREVLTHITGWERWQVTQLRCAFSGDEPTERELVGDVDYPEEDHFPTPDERNATFIAINAHRPLDAILADWRDVSAQQLAFVEGATQDELDELVGVRFSDRMRAVYRLTEVPDAGNPQPAATWITDQLGHRDEHFSEVQAWVEARR